MAPKTNMNSGWHRFPLQIAAAYTSAMIFFILPKLHLPSSHMPYPRSLLDPVTIDPQYLHAFPCNHSVAPAPPLSTPNPILINASCSPQKHRRDSPTPQIRRQTSVALLPHATCSSPLHPTSSMHLDLGQSYLSPTQMILLTLLKEYLSPTASPGPLQSITIFSPTPLILLTQAQITFSHISRSQAHYLSRALQYYIESLYDASSPCHRNISEAHIELPLINPSNGSQIEFTEAEPPVSTADTPSITPDCSSSQPPAPRKEKREKQKQVPMRRSQRIQQKKQTTATKGNYSKKNVKQAEKLPFDLHSPGTPIDMDATLTVLQASGLEINDHIQKMIEDAIQQESNPPNEDQDQEAPLTPLHDPIPPLPIPGFDLPL